MFLSIALKVKNIISKLMAIIAMPALPVLISAPNSFIELGVSASFKKAM